MRGGGKFSATNVLVCVPILSFCLSCAVVACEKAEPLSSDQRSSDLAKSPEMKSYWLPTAALALDSSEGTFLRAALESFIGLLTTADGQYGAPGSRDAIGIGYFGQIPSAPPNAFRPTIEASYAIWSVSQDDPYQGRAIICRAIHTINTPGGSFAKVYSSADEIRYTKRGAPPIATGPGPLSRPTSNVFGGWRLTSDDTASSPADNVACNELHLERYLGRPSSPGWPAQSDPPSIAPTP